MYVKDHMKTDVVTLGKNAKITSVLDSMSDGQFRRVPIVDDGGYLVGLITEGVIQRNSPSNATSLSIHELNYLLSKTKVEDIMVKAVVTIDPDALLEEAAVLMRSKNIGCLPVVVNQKVVGIITLNDIVDSFVAMQGYYNEGTRVVIRVSEDKVGIMSEISKLFSDHNISISHLAVYHELSGIYVLIKTSSKEKELIQSLLKENDYSIESILVR